MPQIEKSNMKYRTYNVAAAEMQDNQQTSTSLNNPTYFMNSTDVPIINNAKIMAHDPMKVDDDENNYALTSCGIGSWRPHWLQKFAKPIYFLLNMSLVGIIQGMTGALFFSSMSTLEKRYAFDSRVSGIILIADNFSQMFISPFVGYVGNKFNRPFIIGVSEIVLALSCFMTASPYFFYGPATHLFSDTSLLLSFNRSNIEYCSADHSQSYDCIEPKGAMVWPAVIILLFGSFFRGIGFTAYFVIGYPYLDDNVSKKNSPMYLSIVQAIRLMGPASGYLISSICLTYYENPYIDPGFGGKDPRFIGAWWLGFCIVGTLLFIVALPMLFFPFEFKNASVKASEIKEKIKKSGGGLEAIKRFVTNPIVLLYLAGNCCRYIGIGGYVMLKTKYIESQYRQSSSASSLITGTISIMPMAIGILSGGFMLSIFRPGARFIFIYVFLVESVTIIAMLSGIFLGCDPINLQGGDWNEIGGYASSVGCNANCSCTTHVFAPICSSDGKSTYFSPCFAGCEPHRSDINVTSPYSTCSCSGNPTIGFCSSDIANCNKLFVYLTVMMSGAIISSTARPADALISFRSVDPMDKGFTMGIVSTMLSIFSFIPYPLIFGAIADASCLVWEEKCGKRGNCWLYDQEKFRLYLHGGAAFFVALGSLFDFIMIFFSDRVKNFYDDEDEVKGENITTDTKLTLEMKEQTIVSTISK